MDLKTIRKISEAIQAKGENAIDLLCTSFLPEMYAKEGAYIATNEIEKYIDNYRELPVQIEYKPLKMHKEIICATTGFERKIYKVNGTKDVEKVQSALRQLLQTHAAFRTVYDHSTSLCKQYTCTDSWYIPVIDIQEVNAAFLRQMSLFSRKNDLQYLSYMFVVRDKEDALYAVIALHFCFDDRRTQKNLHEQLLLFLNQTSQGGASECVGPYEYANMVRMYKDAFKERCSPRIQKELQLFSQLTADAALDAYLNRAKCNHFICKVLSDEALARKITDQPLNFLMGLYSHILRAISGFASFPIYIIDQNRNVFNEKMIHSVIDFIPMVAGDEDKDYYTLFKDFLKSKTPGDLLVENETWDNSQGALPFFNYIPAYDDADNGELIVGDKTQVITVLEREGNSRMSFSAFVKDGMLYMIFDLPASLETVEKILKQTLMGLKRS